MLNHKQSLALLLLIWSFQVYADTRVNVVGLFSNKAIVTINGGPPQALTAGQTKLGIKLVSANSNEGTFLIEGKSQVLRMGQAISVGGGSGDAPAEAGTNSPVNLYADSAGHFYGNLTINGTSLRYVIDSGATTVALNSGDAKYARIDYEKGQEVQMSTANGVVQGYLVTINMLKIGTIILNNVPAVVLEGGSPPVVLLGMSAQNRLDLKRNDSVLTLTKKY